MVGFSLANQENFNLIYICSYCSLLLRDPVQIIDCGHRLCKSCVDEQEGDIIKCPTCHEKALKKNLQIDRGFKNDMQLLIIICSFCDWSDKLNNYQKHLDESHPNPLCIYCEEQFTSVNDLDRHKQFICEKITICCPFKQFGCEGIILRINLTEHYQSEQHQKVLINIARNIKSMIHPETSLQTKLDHSRDIEMITNQLEETNESVAILSNSIEVLKEDIQRLRIESTNYQHELDPLSKEFSKLKTSIQEQNTCLDDLKMKQEVLQQDLITIHGQVNDIKTRSSDGTFIWIIKDVREKFVAAKSGTQTSIYSPPFYSSYTGYKMCARLYLYGDGSACGSYVSLFFVLMRGEYDAILKFPFNYKVIFCLCDQTNKQQHIMDAFRPDTNSNSFQRPRSDMNIASGLPKFVSLKTIEQENNPYIRDDTMFIKIIIDYVEMPKGILSYAINLNPGLTTSIQQKMIEQEMEK